MDKSIDEFFQKKYNRSNYNCAHFASELWLKMVGEDISPKLCGVMTGLSDRKITFDLRRKFERLDSPVEPCLVLMQRPKTPPHIGIFLRGKVLHLKESGAEFQPIDVASFGFTKIGFYK